MIVIAEIVGIVIVWLSFLIIGITHLLFLEQKVNFQLRKMY